MKEFNFIINGGGCSGLSLAYEMEKKGILDKKKLAIIEVRKNYTRDKTWSFWKLNDHDFNDCVIKTWNTFTISTKEKSNHINIKDQPYQSVDSGLFYKKINEKLSKNKNVRFFKNIDEVDKRNSIIFNSVPIEKINKDEIWQHFKGIEIETEKNIFDDSKLILMDFNCDQKNSVHFFYVLPFSPKRALIETTWLSNLNNDSFLDYDIQLEKYIKSNLQIKSYKIKHKEVGKIPLYLTSSHNKENFINIGSAGGMTRLSTGYTFLNILEHSKFICNNLHDKKKLINYKQKNKYIFFDKIFLKVLKNHSELMPDIFLNLFQSNSDSVIKFLSNKSNFIDDIKVILNTKHKIKFLNSLTL